MAWMIGRKGLNRIRVETFSKASLSYQPDAGRLKVEGSEAACRQAWLCVDILLRQFAKQPVLGCEVRRNIEDLADLGIVCKSGAIDERADLRKESVFDVEAKYNVIIFIDRAQKHNFGHSMKMPLHVLGESKATSTIMDKIEHGELFSRRGLGHDKTAAFDKVDGDNVIWKCKPSLCISSSRFVCVCVSECVCV